MTVTVIVSALLSNPQPRPNHTKTTTPKHADYPAARVTVTV